MSDKPYDPRVPLMENGIKLIPGEVGLAKDPYDAVIGPSKHSVQTGQVMVKGNLDEILGDAYLRGIKEIADNNGFLPQNELPLKRASALILEPYQSVKRSASYLEETEGIRTGTNFSDEKPSISHVSFSLSIGYVVLTKKEK